VGNAADRCNKTGRIRVRNVAEKLK